MPATPAQASRQHLASLRVSGTQTPGHHPFLLNIPHLGGCQDEQARPLHEEESDKGGHVSICGRGLKPLELMWLHRFSRKTPWLGAVSRSQRLGGFAPPSRSKQPLRSSRERAWGDERHVGGGRARGRTGDTVVSKQRSSGPGQAGGLPGAGRH